MNALAKNRNTRVFDCISSLVYGAKNVGGFQRGPGATR